MADNSDLLEQLHKLPDAPAAKEARTDSLAMLDELRGLPESQGQPEGKHLWQWLGDQFSEKGAGTAALVGATRGVAETAQGAAQFASRMGSPFQALGLMSGARAGQERMQQNIDQSISQGEQAYAADPAVQEHPGFATAGRIGGGMAATAPLQALVPGAGATSLAAKMARGMAAGGLGGATQPVIGENDDYWTAKKKQLELSTAIGGITGGAIGALGPHRPVATQMSEAGVPLTPGMQLGMRGFEKTLETFPVLGTMIRRGEAKSLDGFQRAVGNQVLEPIGGTVPKNLSGGHRMVEFVEDRLDDAYNKVLPKISFSEGEWNNLKSSPDFAAIAQGLPQQTASDLGRILQSDFGNKFVGGMLTGPQYKIAERAIRGKALALNRANQDPLLSQALDESLSLIRQSLFNQNGMYAKDLKNIDLGWAMWSRMRKAASKAGNKGQFTPYDLQQAAQNLDRSPGKGSFATGDALLQPFAEAADLALGKVAPPGSAIPSRGLHNLTALMGLGGGGGFLHGGPAGAGAGAAAAGAAPYVAGAAMQGAAAVGRAPPAVQAGIAAASGRQAAAYSEERSRAQARMRAAAKIGEKKTEEARAMGKGDFVAAQKARNELKDLREDYRRLGGGM